MIKTTATLRFALVPALVAIMFALGCAKPAQTMSPPNTLSIGVASFTQPTNIADMLAGYMPEKNKPANPEIFPQLDSFFMTELGQKTQRTFLSASLADGCQPGRGSQNALKYWAGVGRCMGVDLIIVPQIITWQERDGGPAGVERPAGVTADFFLIDVKKETLVARSHYEEIQQDLASNLLNTGKFIERGGKWVGAFELSKEAMRKAIKDFML